MSMAMDSSHRVIRGGGNVVSSKFGQIGPRSAELAALEGLEKNP